MDDTDEERPSDGLSYEELARAYDEWASKDGNSPGYNLQKARNYGAQAAFWRSRALELGASHDEWAKHCAAQDRRKAQ